MPAEREEIVRRPDPVDPQHLRPDTRDDFLGRSPRRDESFVPARQIRCRQRIAVQLAGPHHRQRVQRHEVRRHHVVRQGLPQRGADRGKVEPAHAIPRHDIGNKLPVAAMVRPRQHRRLAHARHRRQRRVDLAKLDAHAADLHLVVTSAEIFDRAVRQIPRDIAGAIHPGAARLGEGVWNEFLRGEIRAPQIAASQADTANVQLAGDTDRHRLQSLVEDVSAGIADRRPDRRRDRGSRSAMMNDGIDRDLGRAVGVIEVAPLGPGPDQQAQITAADDRAQIGQPVRREAAQHDRRQQRDVNSKLPQRRFEIAARHQLFARRKAQRRAARQRNEDLPGRCVEIERCELQQTLARPDPIGGARGQHQIAQAMMRHQRALRQSRRSRGVNHVGEILRPTEVDRIGLGASVEPMPVAIEAEDRSPNVGEAIRQIRPRQDQDPVRRPRP